MVMNDALDMIIGRLLERNLGEAITAAENFLAVHPHQVYADRLQAIKTDFLLMTGYWQRGYKDPQLPELYDNLLQRMYRLYAAIALGYSIHHSSFLESLYCHVRTTLRDWSPQVVREGLEAFVSDVALSGLQNSEAGPSSVAVAVSKEELYIRHHGEMVELFDNILTSGVWTDGYAAAMEDILLSPTVDTVDQQLILSSVMLSAMNMFDIAKFRMMAHVYQKAVDEQVRQRALIGWVFSMDAAVGQSICPEMLQLISEMLRSEDCCRELVELQKQLIYCIDAERDRQTLQEEIMPDLLSHNGFRITRDGIIEEQEDELSDILRPDLEEEKLERVEQSFHRMIDMQRQGSDIYFGGFSQMKRFPFFHEMMNWFVPFYIDHPDVRSAAAKYRDNSFLKSLFNSGPFCNSDKYSFLLAFDQVVNRLPDNLREVMERGELPLNEIAAEEMQTPAYIRRICLQDLYRFFRLYPQRQDFRNIFDTDAGLPYLVLASPVFRCTPVGAFFGEIAAFLMKRTHRQEAVNMLDNYDENRCDFQYYMMSAHLGRNRRENYARALELQPDNERALAGYARALFSEGCYQEALDTYDRLLSSLPPLTTLNTRTPPKFKSYQLNKAVCLSSLHRYDEAEKMLFRLNYEWSDDVNVIRVLAWTLTGNGKYDQAEKLYVQLRENDNLSTDDLLNYGYSLWFAGKIDEAAGCFRYYLKESGETKESVIKNELEMIRVKGITEPEIKMMLYIL